MHTRRLASCTFFSLLLFVGPRALAQNPPPEPIDQVKGGTGGEFEHIDLSNGGVNLSVPIYNIKGRGVNAHYAVNYSSKNWYTIISAPNGQFWEHTQPWSADNGFPGETGSSSAIIDYCTWHPGGGNPPQQNPITAYYNSNWMYPDGSTKLYPWLQISLSYQGCDTPPTMAQYLHPYPYDGSSISYPFLYPDGTSGFGDSNGNSNGANLDSAGRTQPTFTWSNNNTVLTITLLTGSQVVLKYGSVSVATAFQNPTGAHNYTGTFTRMLSEIDLPNGTSWQFQYATNSYGQLTKVILPTGGYIRYTYAVQPKFATNTPFGSGGIIKPSLADSLVVTGRYVSSDGVTEQGETYTYVATNNGTSVTQRITTHLSATGDQQVHIFGFLGPDHSLLETDTQYYQKTTKNLREVLRAWTCDTVPNLVGTTPPSGKGPGQIPGSASIGIGQGNCRVTQETTMAFDGASPLTKTVQYQYDSNLHDTFPQQAYFHVQMGNYTTTFNNVSQTLESDWGPGGTPGTPTTPGTPGTAGPLLRETDVTYLTTNPQNGNIDYTQPTVHIVNRPVLKVIKDGQGNILAQTSYQYDGSSLIDTSGTPAPQHDYTNYSHTNLTRGNLTQTSRWLSSSGNWLSTNSAYDDLGNLRSQTDPNNNTIQFSYVDNYDDRVNRSSQAYLTQTTEPMTGTVSHITKKSYYYNTALPYQDTDANGQVTTYSFDNMNRPLVTTYADGGQLSDSYHDASPFSVTTTTKITGSLNRVTTALLDALGRTKQTQLSSDPDGTTYVDTTYDPAGRTASVSNPYRSTGDSTYGTTSYIYDGLGRTCVVIPSDGTAVTGNTCPASAPARDIFTNFAGNLTTVTDQAGNIRQRKNDGLGRLVQVLEPNSSNSLIYETDYQYDALGNLLCVEQHGGVTGTGCSSAPGNDATSPWRVRRYNYDSLSRVISSSVPESNTAQTPSLTTVSSNYSYDADGNLTYKTIPAQNQTGTSTVTLTYCYDALNRITAKAYTFQTCVNGSLPSPVATYSYDQGNASAYPIGHRTGMTDLAGSEIWTYDQVGRINSIQRTNNSYPNAVQKITTYTYNYDGSLSTLTYPSGRTIAYGPGAAGQAVSAIDSANGINYATNAHYTPHGVLASLTNGTNLYSTRIFNSRLQPCWLYTTTGTPLPWNATQCAGTTTVGTVLDLKYNYGLGIADNGNILGITNNRDTTRTQSFTYDRLNRLSTAQTTSTYSTSPANCWGEQLNYDVRGNLLGISSLSSAYTGCSGENLSVGVTNQNQISGNTYDTAGNLTIETGPTTYTYDGENHLTSTAGQIYNYDGEGRRVSKAPTNAPTQPTKLYWYDSGSNVIDETDGSGSTSNSAFSEYIFFGGRRSARRDFSSNVYYYFSDHLGTSRVLVLSGQTSPCYDGDFYPFGGERTPVVNNCSQNYKFTGKERDSESGLDNFGARYDSSSLGRFMSPDSGSFNAVNPQSLNRYIYALDNPLRYIDPDGNEVFDIGGYTLTTYTQRSDEIDPLAWLQLILPTSGVRGGRWMKTVGIGRDSFELKGSPSAGDGLTTGAWFTRGDSKWTISVDFEGSGSTTTASISFALKPGMWFISNARDVRTEFRPSTWPHLVASDYTFNNLGSLSPDQLNALTTEAKTQWERTHDLRYWQILLALENEKRRREQDLLEEKQRQKEECDKKGGGDACDVIRSSPDPQARPSS